MRARPAHLPSARDARVGVRKFLGVGSVSKSTKWSDWAERATQVLDETTQYFEHARAVVLGQPGRWAPPKAIPDIAPATHVPLLE
eukprot:4570631-Alexandrium_andersonii.AAC.1